MQRETTRAQPTGAEERFRAARELLRGPRLLHISSHPVRWLWHRIRSLFADHTVVHGPEILPADEARRVRELLGGEEGEVLALGPGQALRPDIAHTLFCAIAGRHGAARVIAAGRVFRAGAGGELAAPAFHQCGALAIGEGLSGDDLRWTFIGLCKNLLPERDLHFEKAARAAFAEWWRVALPWRGTMVHVASGGVLRGEALARWGFADKRFSGILWKLGLERVALVRLGLERVAEVQEEGLRVGW